MNARPNDITQRLSENSRTARYDEEAKLNLNWKRQGNLSETKRNNE